ncbi:MAG: hypothetical protein ACE5EM_06860 [Sphingomonadales bacterium]
MRSTGSLFIASLSAVAALFFAPGHAWSATATAADARRYQACVAKSERDPETALEDALDWRDNGGGVPARHCAALAQVALRQFDLAAQRLEEIANDMDLVRREADPNLKFDDEMRAEILSQAGNAWLLSGKPAKAYLAFSDALVDVPEWSARQAELLIDRARALAEIGDFQAATDDLDRAARIEPRNVEVYIFRASARRSLEKLDEAQSDVEKALALEPDNILALLERGNLNGLAGDPERAREDWSRIIEQAPGTPAADAAARNLAKLDNTENAGEGGSVNSTATPPLLLDPAQD